METIEKTQYMETDGRERLYKDGRRGQLWCRSDITAKLPHKNCRFCWDIL